jgi:hypothetical protein
MKKVCFSLVFAALTLICFRVAQAQKVVDQKPLQVISWLEGKWVKAYGDKLREEHWSFMGGSFLGMCREISNSDSSVIQIMTIEQEGDETVMKIRHFSKGLKVAFEEKDKTAIFKLKEYDKKNALFVGIGENEGESFAYKLLAKELLEITVQTNQNGKSKTEIYRMKRV